MDLVLTHGTVVTCDATSTVIRDGAVVMQGDAIVAVGNSQDIEAQFPQVEHLDIAACSCRRFLIRMSMSL